MDKKLNDKYKTQDFEEKLYQDFTGFPYLALWSKKGAPFVCIEPWQNTADRIDSTQIYKDKENIIELPKDKEYKCEFKIKIL